MRFRAGWKGGLLRDLWIACPPGQAFDGIAIDEGSTHRDAYYRLSIKIAPIWPCAYFYDQWNNEFVDAFHLLLD